MISDWRRQPIWRKSFVYGLPELNKANKKNNYIANPGCFAAMIGFFAAADDY
jgi:N-acetyl-gamma-glutamylphosphate reductase